MLLKKVARIALLVLPCIAATALVTGQDISSHPSDFIEIEGNKLFFDRSDGFTQLQIIESAAKGSLIVNQFITENANKTVTLDGYPVRLSTPNGYQFPSVPGVSINNGEVFVNLNEARAGLDAGYSLQTLDYFRAVNILSSRIDYLNGQSVIDVAGAVINTFINKTFLGLAGVSGFDKGQISGSLLSKITGNGAGEAIGTLNDLRLAHEYRYEAIIKSLGGQVVLQFLEIDGSGNVSVVSSLSASEFFGNPEARADALAEVSSKNAFDDFQNDLRNKNNGKLQSTGKNVKNEESEYQVDKKFEFTASDGTKYGFLDDGFSFDFVPTKELVNYKVFTEASDYSISEFNLFRTETSNLLPAGVDFTNISVSSIDVNSANQTIEFILNGTRTSSGSGATLNSESDLLKKVFLQALSIPNSDHWVSLDRVTSGGSVVGQANATSAFKNTDICRLFFAADAKMKVDLYDELAQLGESRGVFNLWLDIFQQNMSTYNALKNKGLTFPNVLMRGLIVPDIPSGRKENDGKIFLSDAKYRVDPYIDDINYGSFNTGSLTSSQLIYYLDRAEEFRIALSQKMSVASSNVASDINAGARAEYRQIKKILPAIAAAHWYKSRNSGNADAQYYPLIDTKNLGSGFTGYSLATSEPFNQTYWDNQANTILGYETFTVDGQTYTVQVRGGVNNQDTRVGNISVGLTSAQRNVLFNATNNAIVDNKYVNTGTVNSTNLPELTVAGIDLFYAPTRATSAEGYPANTAAALAVKCYNVSNTSATGVKVDLYYQALNASGNPTGTKYLIEKKTVGTMGGYSDKTVYVAFTTPNVGDWIIYADVNASRGIREVAYGNNVRKLKFTTTWYSDVFNDVDAFLSGDYAYGNGQTEQFDASSIIIGGNVRLESGSDIAYNYGKRVVLAPGFKAKTGSKMVIKAKTYSGASSRSNSRVGQSTYTTVYERDELYVPFVDNSDAWSGYKESLFGEAQELSLPIYTSFEIIDDIGGFVSFPNPCQDEINVDYEVHKSAELSLSLYNLEGKLVTELMPITWIEPGLHHQSYDATTLNKGQYVLVLRTSDGIIASQQILKQ